MRFIRGEFSSSRSSNSSSAAASAAIAAVFAVAAAAATAVADLDVSADADFAVAVWICGALCSNVPLFTAAVIVLGVVDVSDFLLAAETDAAVAAGGAGVGADEGLLPLGVELDNSEKRHYLHYLILDLGQFSYLHPLIHNKVTLNIVYACAHKFYSEMIEEKNGIVIKSLHHLAHMYCLTALEQLKLSSASSLTLSFPSCLCCFVLGVL